MKVKYPTSDGGILELESSNYPYLNLVHALVDGDYDYTMLQQRIMFFVFQCYQQHRKAPCFRIKMSDLKPPESKSNSIYERIKKELPFLVSKTFSISTGPNNENRLHVGIISSAEYLKKEKEIEFIIDPKMKGFLDQGVEESKQGNFASINIPELLTLSSKYTQKLYLQLSKWKFKGYWRASIEQMRLYTNTTDKYNNYAQWKQNVLLKAKEDLKDTNFKFEIEEHKENKSKKVAAVTLHLLYQDKMNEHKESELYSRLVNDYKISPHRATIITMKISETDIRKTLHTITIKNQDGKIENIGAYSWTLFSRNFDLRP